MKIKLQIFFCVIPDTRHDYCLYLLNGLVLCSNVSRSKMLQSCMIYLWIVSFFLIFSIKLDILK